MANQLSVITIDDQDSSQIWNLSVEQRPLSTLQSLVRLLSSGAIPAAAGQAQSSQSLESLWQQFRTQYPAGFATAPKEIAGWHEFQAHQSELQAQWFAAVFHLEHLLSLRSGDAALTQRLARAKEHLRNGN